MYWKEKQKEIKAIEIVKEEVYQSLFADNMTMYIENSKKSTKKLLDLISEYSKAAGYKVNTQKLQNIAERNSRLK